MELEGWFCRFQVGPWSHDWNTTATKTTSALVHCSFGPRWSVKLRCADSPYLAQIRAWTPEHSLIRIGKSGLDFFRFTYCCSTKSLHTEVHFKFTQTCLFHVLLNNVSVTECLDTVANNFIPSLQTSDFCKIKVICFCFPAILNRNKLKPRW